MLKHSLRNILIVSTVLSLAAIGFTLWGARSRGDTEMHASEPAPELVVPVVKVERTDLARSVRLTAEFKPFQDVEVMAKVAGYVKRIYVDVGDHVQQGQLLAVLEVPEMADELVRVRAGIDRSTAEVARARDEVQRAESSHRIAHLAYTRLSSVMKDRPGLVAEQEIDDAHGRDLVAEAQVAAAKSSLTAAEQTVQMNKAEQAKAQTLMAYTKVVAPFAGVVTKRFADTGSMIQAGTASQTQAMPLVRLAESTTLRLILPVPESAVPKIHLGQPVEVSVPTLGRTIQGRVARFADVVDRSTRTMSTEVDVPNSSYALMPGMYAEVTLALDRRERALSIPLGASEAGSEAARVYVVTPSGTVEIRDVELGLEGSDRVEVRSGLKDGELVIAPRRAGLKPGQHVTPKLVIPAKAS